MSRPAKAQPSIAFPVFEAQTQRDIFPASDGAYNNVDPTPKWRHYGTHVRTLAKKNVILTK